MTILFASSNQGKIAELVTLFKNTPFALKTSRDTDTPAIDVEETGATFEENALLKAQAYGRKYNLPTLADDSGLCVCALGNKPGVQSNRWVAGSDHARNSALLDSIKDYQDRRAFFVTALCFYTPSDNTHHFFRGEVHGTIATEEKGTQGFGYDPVFIPKDYQETFAELGTETKNKLSHRARALETFFTFLTTKYKVPQTHGKPIHSFKKDS